MILYQKKKGIRGPYKKRNPTYYYYKINNKTYKCTKSISSVYYDFYKCRDTNCPASGKYSKITNKFTNEGIHIQYEKHSFIIPEIFNNGFKKKDLLNFNLDSEEKILSFFRTYFKYYNETCEMAKNKFEKIYPLINMKDKDLQYKINNVYLYSQRKNKDRRSVLDKILDISNSKGEKLSKLYEYTSKKVKAIKKFFIIISNNKMRNK